MEHEPFPIFAPIVVLKGTSVSINLYLGQVSRSGDSLPSVNMILRCCRQFPTSWVTLSTLSLIWKGRSARVPRSGAEASEKEGKGGFVTRRDEST